MRTRRAGLGMKVRMCFYFSASLRMEADPVLWVIHQSTGDLVDRHGDRS